MAGHEVKYLLALLVFAGCSSNKSLHSRAQEYPDIKLVVFSAIMDLSGDGTPDSFVYGYDLDGDGAEADLWAIHRLASGEEGNYKLSARPFVFVWLKNGEPYARQHDADVDGKIESISGDVKRLVKQLENLNRGFEITSLDAL